MARAPEATEGKMGVVWGYARVSTDDQSLDVQREALNAAGCEMIREEKRSGASQEGRDELGLLLEFIRPGDVLVVTKLDRLARSIRDVMDIHDRLTKSGATLKILNMQLDTSAPTGKLMLGVLGCVAEFERDMIKERQREGIKAAKEKGVYTGGKRRHDPAQIKALKDEGKSHSQIQGILGCSDETIRRALRGIENVQG